MAKKVEAMLLRLPRIFSLKVLRGLRVVTVSSSIVNTNVIQYQIASRPDELQCSRNVGINNRSRHGDNP